MKKLLLIAGLVIAGALVIGRWIGSGRDAVVADPQLAFDRLWIDRLPTRPKDNFNTFVAVTQEPLGVFQAGSQWKGTYELFSHEARGDELRLTFLQTGEKEKVKIRAWRCSEGGMHYCLELQGSSRGVKRYHSQRGWEIGGVKGPEQLRGRIEAVVQTLRTRHTLPPPRTLDTPRTLP